MSTANWTGQTREEQIAAIEKDWAENPRWKGIKRGYSAADVVKLRGSVKVEHTHAQRGAEKLWNLINTEPFVNSLGAMTGNQAMQQDISYRALFQHIGRSYFEKPSCRTRCSS